LSGCKNNIGSHNTFIGACAGCDVTTGLGNTIVGNVPGTSNLSNTLILGTGSYASCERLKVNNCGLYINGLPFSVSRLTACYNFFVTCGNPSITSGACNNISLGYKSGCCLTSGSDNFFAGQCAGWVTTSGSKNIFLGFNAGSSVNTGSNNTIIGSIEGSYGLINTVILGAGSCERFKVNDNGFYINGSLVNTASLTSQQNFFVNDGLSSLTSTGCDNIAIGKCAGRALTFGSCNFFAI
jgi:hypothetical protein